MSETELKDLPPLRSGLDLNRSRYFSSFIQAHKPSLQYVYNELLPEHHRNNISFNQWVSFAFHHTSKNGLRG